MFAVGYLFRESLEAPRCKKAGSSSSENCFAPLIFTDTDSVPNATSVASSASSVFADNKITKWLPWDRFEIDKKATVCYELVRYK